VPVAHAEKNREAHQVRKRFGLFAGPGKQGGAAADLPVAVRDFLNDMGRRLAAAAHVLQVILNVFEPFGSAMSEK
jgi:hypothetical protein